MVGTGIKAGIAAKHNEAAAIVAQMTLQEKAACASGKNFWYLEGCERLGVEPVMVTDGPHGLRKQSAEGDHVGLNKSVPATCFPTASALAASWDVDLLREIGVALGEQCVAERVAVLLGPGMNIKRHPLCGRNFEYFSEDPLLNGEIAAAMIEGVQSQGVGTSIKHYAVNNQEAGRMYMDAVVDDRTLREIYLRGFEIAVRKAQPWTVMCAYNRVNGTYCGEHDWLLNQVLRDEWGFQGLVVTDWGAANDRVAGVGAGLDLEMPASGGINDRRIEEAVASGNLKEDLLDKMIARNVALSLAGADLAEKDSSCDQHAHHDLARRAAAESAVLLKNEDQALPLEIEGGRAAGGIAVIGAFAKHPRYQGTGSSQVTPTQLDTVYDALVQAVGEESIRYAEGYEPVFSAEDPALIESAVETASGADVVLVFAGLPETYESEGFDRRHMRMPAQHDRLIEAICDANANTIVILSNGAPVEMPWVERPRAILEAYLAGQAGGSAIVDLLLGRANPSGRLAETFPRKQTDVPSDPWFPGSDRQIPYREGCYVGYRFFDSAEVDVLFPFGHGLSYTRFEHTDLDVAVEGQNVTVSLTVTNSGSQAGADVVQVYVHDVESSAYRPAQELKGFAKVRLDAGESRRIGIDLGREAFALYDVEAQAWLVEGGAFEIRVGSSSRDIRQRQRVTIASQDRLSARARLPGPGLADGLIVTGDEVCAGMLGRPVPAAEPVRPFHINSALVEVGEHSWLGRRFKARVIAGFKKNMGVNDGDVADPTLALMFEEMANHMPMRSFALFSRGKMNFRQVFALVALFNHRYFEALRLILGGEIRWERPDGNG